MASSLWHLILLACLVAPALSQGHLDVSSRKLLLADKDSERIKELEADMKAFVAGQSAGTTRFAPMKVDAATSRFAPMKVFPITPHNLPPVATFIIDCNGGGNFTSINAAVAAIVPIRKKKGLQGRIVFNIRKCVYKEKVLIPRNLWDVTFQGANAYNTIVTWGDSAGSSTPGGAKGKKTGKLGTLYSSTFAVQANGFIVRDMTFENTFGPPKEGSTDGQAVAYRIEGDRAAHYHCRFLGWQDTLYDRLNRHYFYNCYIEGSTDFIFGDGQSVYEQCNIFGKVPRAVSIAAQKRESSSGSSGYVFLKSRILGQAKLSLGRAWGAYSRVVYANCFLGDVVDPEDPWSDFGQSSSRSTVFFAEFNNTGPGAVTTPRNTWSLILTAAQAQPFLSTAFIDGASWMPPRQLSRSGRVAN